MGFFRSSSLELYRRQSETIATQKVKKDVQSNSINFSNVNCARPNSGNTGANTTKVDWGTVKPRGSGWAAPEEHTLPDDDTRAEVEVLLHDLQQLLLAPLGGPIVEDGDGQGVSHSNGVRHLRKQVND